MASAEIIGAAIGILLMMIVAYLLVGSTLTAAEIVTTAQKDVTLQNEARLQTDINIFYLPPNYPKDYPATKTVEIIVNNTGSEMIGGFAHWDVYAYWSTSGYERYSYIPSGVPLATEWTIFKFERDFVHPSMLDPGEAVWIRATYSGIKPERVKVSTANGVYTEALIP